MALSEDGQIMNWCYSQDEESAQKELLDRRKYPGYIPIWVSNKEINVGYKNALKKHEEVQYAKSARKNGN